MKLKLLTATAALITSTVVSAADVSVDGKGMICLGEVGRYAGWKLPWSGHWWEFFEFTDGKVSASSMSDGKSAVELDRYKAVPYVATADEVRWRPSVTPAPPFYTLNRQTMRLEIRNHVMQLMTTLDCEPYGTHQAFDAALEKVLKDENEARDAYMSKNKI